MTGNQLVYSILGLSFVAATLAAYFIGIGQTTLGAWLGGTFGLLILSTIHLKPDHLGGEK